MKQEINVLAYARQILEAVNKGVLLTTAADGEVNTMTIGWAALESSGISRCLQSMCGKAGTQKPFWIRTQSLLSTSLWVRWIKRF